LVCDHDKLPENGFEWNFSPIRGYEPAKETDEKIS
jgi:hypothetical protein